VGRRSSDRGKRDPEETGPITMDIVTILRELRRRRRSVVAAGLVAVLAAVLVMYQVPGFKSRSHDVGVATTQILLDTPSSQVVAVAPKGSESLGMRANLLASLMVDGDVESEIAHRAGLQPNQLGGTTDAAMNNSPGSSLSTPAPSTRSRPYVLTTHILSDATNMPLPIIEVDVQAPTSDAAVRLAQAAVLGLKDYLTSTAAEERIPDVQRLDVEGLGVPQGATVTQGPTVVVGVLVAMFVFVLGCASILAGSTLRRRWRAAAEREALEAQSLLPTDVVTPPVQPAESAVRPAEPTPAPQAAVERDPPGENGSGPHEQFVEPDEPVGADLATTPPQPPDLAAAAPSPVERRADGETLLSILRRSRQVEPDDGDGEGGPSEGPHLRAAGESTQPDHESAALPVLDTRRAFYSSAGRD
jgi:hypothetical protein